MKPFLKQISYLLPYLRPHGRVLAFSFILSIVATALGMVQPYFAKILIDRVLLGRAPDLLAWLLGLMILLFIVSFTIRVGNNYMYTRYSARLLFKMREDLFQHLFKIPIRFFTRRKIGDIYSRVAGDMAEIQALLTDILPQYIFNFLTCLITAGILFHLHWEMTLMSLGYLPVALLVIHKIRPRLLALTREVTEKNADIAHFLFESLGGAGLIRAFGAEAAENEKLKEKQSHVLTLLLRHQVLGIYSGTVPTVFVIINTLIVFGCGGRLVLGDALSVGSLVAFSIYQGRLLGPMQGLMDGFLAAQKSKIALERVREILGIPLEARSTGERVIQKEKLKGEIGFAGVAFAYEADEPVLADLTFRIPPGKITALVGPSGVGKTTICHLILGLLPPDAGRITLDAIDLRELKTEWLRKRLAIVAQDVFLFHASILENIRFSNPGADDEAVGEAVRAACIHEFIQTLPNGWRTEVGDRGVRLSGGQKQRIAIARAILMDPKILILDEATAFLDPTVEDRLKETIRHLMKNRTIVVVSHRLSTIRSADHVIALENTGLVYEGPWKGFEAFKQKGCSQRP
ncbi:MAG: ABC transporter ATP-binding protein [Desulfobacterales bacterium]|nr:ABC transporter ATP-binding protein [Desulfobacterales bacterium]